LIKTVLDDGAGTQPERDDYFTFVGYPLQFVRDDLFYPACPTPNCNRKVQHLQDDVYGEEKLRFIFFLLY
jgi:hypothetical protein